MFLKGGATDTIDGVIRQLMLLLVDMRTAYGECIVIPYDDNSTNTRNRCVMFTKDTIRLIYSFKSSKKEILFNARDGRLSEKDHEVSSGYFPAFGSEVVNIVSRLMNKKARIYSVST